jgi:hypothetical protein
MLIAILALLALPVLAEPSTTKLLFRDYGLTEVHKVGALSFGACSWSDSDEDFALGGYLDFKFLMLLEEKLNVGVGIIAKPPAASAEHNGPDVRLETSVTSHWFNFLEVGVYYSPFWGLAGKDDPWGLMAGVYLKF